MKLPMLRTISPLVTTIQLFSQSKTHFLLDETIDEQLKNAIIVKYGATTNRDILIFSLKSALLVSPLNVENFTTLAALNPSVKSFFFENDQNLNCGLLIL